MPRNTKDLENSKKEELEKKVENKKVESKSQNLIAGNYLT